MGEEKSAFSFGWIRGEGDDVPLKRPLQKTREVLPSLPGTETPGYIPLDEQGFQRSAVRGDSGHRPTQVIGR